MALYQPDREREVLEAAERANRGPLSEAAIRRLFERILDEARSVERTVMHDEASQPAKAISALQTLCKNAQRFL